MNNLPVAGSKRTPWRIPRLYRARPVIIPSLPGLEVIRMLQLLYTE